MTQRIKGASGATLLEILMAMVVIGLVAGGILTAFVFGRRVTWRSGTELSGAGLINETADGLRAVISGGGGAGLSLVPGVYRDQNMVNPPAGATAQAALNFPNDFLRFQTDPGNPAAVPTNIANPATHGDGRLVVVEGLEDRNGDNVATIAENDFDGDGYAGLDFDGDKQADLRRVRVRVKWTSPTS